MRKVNALYEPEDDGSLERPGVWPSKPVIQRAAPIPPSPYQTHLDAGLEPPPLSTSSVRYWSDYSRVYYHPKSLVQLSEFDVNDSLMPFETWQVGMDLFEKLEREADLVDRDLRPFVEECDGLQGIQIMTGIDDAWGGWASAWLERLRDDYGKLSIWTWGLGDQGGNMSIPRVRHCPHRRCSANGDQEKRLQQIENSARSLHVLAEHSSVYIPMSNKPAKGSPYLSMDASSPWHVGALHAISLESITMSSRLRSSHARRGTLQDLEETFNSTGKRRIAKLELSVADPDVLAEKSSQQIAQAEKVGSTASPTASDVDEEQMTAFDIDMFSKDYRVANFRSRRNEHVFGRVETSRGEWNFADDRDPRDRVAEAPTIQRYVATPAHLFSPHTLTYRRPLAFLLSAANRGRSAFLNAGNYRKSIRPTNPDTHRISAPLLFPLLDSFPASIFDVGSVNASKFAVHAALTTSTAVADQVRAVEQIVRRMHMVSLDEREALCNGLQTMAEEYDEGWDSGSDSDEDD